MTLCLTNTMKRTKEPFVPANPDHVAMYVCGPTVYNFAHIGNVRPAVVFDVLYRLLKRRFGLVVYARNFTDADDKSNAAAKARMSAAYRNNPAIFPPSEVTKASEFPVYLGEDYERLIEDTWARIQAA